MTKDIQVKENNSMLSPFGSLSSFETAQRMAVALAKSTFIPKEFRGNIGDCLILLETASRTGMPIMALMQSTYVVHGKPSFSSAFMAGLINNSKRFDFPLRFKYDDQKTSCYAYTSKDGEEYRGIVVTMKMAKAEGWADKNGSKWKTMPELMLQYRATSFFARAYCSDLIMGMKEQHEVADSHDPPGQDYKEDANKNLLDLDPETGAVTLIPDNVAPDNTAPTAEEISRLEGAIKEPSAPEGTRGPDY